MSTSQDAKAPEYFIKREWRSSFRLNFNHLLMKDVGGGLLSADIPTNKDNLRIADVGTGTAAWALDAAVKYPNAQVDGFDVSDEQFSPLYGIKNVKLIVHDCWEPFPAEYIGKYDIVHARFWLCIVNNPDAPRLLERLCSLLKPGGYLQWFELQALSTSTRKPEPDIDTPMMDQFVKLYKKPRPDSSYEWVDQLPEAFRAQDLENVSAKVNWIRDHQRQLWMHSNLAGLEDTITEELHNIGKAEQIRSFSLALQAEMKRGIAFETAFITVVGQKPQD